MTTEKFMEKIEAIIVELNENIFKDDEMDSEMMQHILKETGMEWQMLRQLVLTMPIEQVEYLIEERKNLGL